MSATANPNGEGIVVTIPTRLRSDDGRESIEALTDWTNLLEDVLAKATL